MSKLSEAMEQKFEGKPQPPNSGGELRSIRNKQRGLRTLLEYEPCPVCGFKHQKATLSTSCIKCRCGAKLGVCDE